MEIDGEAEGRSSCAREGATMGRGQEGSTVGSPMPALGLNYDGPADGRKRKANKSRTAPRMRPEQLQKGGAMESGVGVSGGGAGRGQRGLRAEKQGGLRPGARRGTWKGLGA